MKRGVRCMGVLDSWCTLQRAPWLKALLPKQALNNREGCIRAVLDELREHGDGHLECEGRSNRQAAM